MTRTNSAGGDVVIVESPALATAIERSLGPGSHGTARAGRACWRVTS